MRELIAAWLRDSRHLRWAIVALAAIVLLGGVAFAFSAWQSAQEARGRLALAAAVELAQQASGPTAPAGSRERAAAALEAVLAEHPRFSGGPEAAYRLGNLRYELGQHAAARGAFEIALGKGASGTLRGLVALGIAYTHEAQKDYAKAQTAYQAALAGLAPRDFLFEEVLLGLARTQEFGGNPAGARDSYARLLKDRPDTRRADDIRSRLASLAAPQK